MLASIHPLGEQGRRQRWSITVVAYIAATVAGAAALGTALGWLGAMLMAGGPPSGLWVAAVAVLATVGVALDLRVRGLRVPTIHRQVDEEWLGRYRGWVYGAGYGFQLGLGVVTVVSSFTVYLVMALAIVTASPLAGMVVGAAFGLVRGTTILAAANVRDRSSLHRLHRRLARWEPVTNGLAIGVQALVAAGGLATALAR